MRPGTGRPLSAAGRAGKLWRAKKSSAGGAMSAGASAGAAAAAAAAVVQAIKASGAIVRVEPAAFQAVVGRQPGPLVVHATTGLFSTYHVYLSSYKGLAFVTTAPDPHDLPAASELVEAQKIWVPG